MYKILLIICLFSNLHIFNESKKHDGEEKPAWAKKDIRDYNEADLERLLDQWEVSSLFSASNWSLWFGGLEFSQRLPLCVS